MPEAQATPKWKRICRLVLRVYGALCTLLVTACIALWLWSVLFPRRTSPQAGGGQALFMTSYGAYMAAEYPQRGNRFSSMIEALCEYVAENPMPENELFRYLGRPDQFYLTNVIVSEPDHPSVTNRIVLFAYMFDRPGTTNRGRATVLESDGKVEQVTLVHYEPGEGPAFQPFPADAAPNPQGGANGRQPSSSETNSAPAAAASRHSP
jgi:hypothetical protein